jgi:hypothetical protein
MGYLSVLSVSITPFAFVLAVLGSVFAALLLRIVYCQFFHPLSKFPGPWWATSFSVVGAVISVKYKEPQFLTYLIEKYGSTYPLSARDVSYPRFYRPLRYDVPSRLAFRTCGATSHLPFDRLTPSFSRPTNPHIAHNAGLPASIGRSRYLLGPEV